MINSNSRKCKYCGKDIIYHRKCKQCDILLHEANDKYRCKLGGIQYTLESPRINYCMQCFITGIVSPEKLAQKNAAQFKN